MTQADPCRRSFTLSPWSGMSGDIYAVLLEGVPELNWNPFKTGRQSLRPGTTLDAFNITSGFIQSRREEGVMADLKIRVYKSGESAPDTTVTIPGGILKIASKLIPRQARESLQEKGIDLEEIIRLSENPDAHGTLVEVEEHKKHERVIISLE